MTVEARIIPLEPPYDDDIAKILDRMMGGLDVEPLRLFRVVAHNRHLLDKFRSAGSYLLNFGTLEPLEREIVIHRTCARSGSEYEWGVHVVVFGRSVGLSDAQIDATVTGDAGDPVWSPRQGLLVRLVDELLDTTGVSDELWVELAAGWTPEQLVELVVLVGQYTLVSMLTNAFMIRSEGFAASFPPARVRGPARRDPTRGPSR